MNNKKLYIIGAICFFVGLVVGWLVSQSADNMGAIGNNRFPNSGLAARSLYIGGSVATTTLTDGTASIGALQLDSGSTIIEHSCATLTTWNPGNLITNATTTQDISLSGAAIGDLCVASLASSSVAAAVDVGCQVSGAGTSTVTVQNLDVAVNFTTSTLRTCYFGY